MSIFEVSAYGLPGASKLFQDHDWAERKRTLRRLSTLTQIQARKASVDLPSSPGASSAPHPEIEHKSSGTASRKVSIMVTQEKTGWRKYAANLQYIYERSRIKQTFPILLLIGYSFFGGFIFYSIEQPNEVGTIATKRNYVLEERSNLAEVVWHYTKKTIDLEKDFELSNDQTLYVKRWKMVRNDARMEFRRVVYWYTLVTYYLSDQKSKAQALRPRDLEKHFEEIFKANMLGPLKVLQNYTEQLAERFWEIANERNDTPADAPEELKRNITERKMNESLELFQSFTGISDAVKPMWTFWNSMFLAMTTYTTIGYGNIVPKTRSGQLVAIFYAIFGIPMVLMILHKLGHFFLILLQRFWDFLIWFFERCKCVQQPEKLKSRSQIVVDTSQGTQSYNVPVSLAVGVTFGWMFVCASIFLHFEKDWDYFTSFYFFFISLTTIGFGDVTPSKSEDVFLIFGLIIIGLSLVGMCINVVQLKIERLFEDLMLAMMEEYQIAQLTDGDIGPPPDMKAGFMQLWRMWNKRKSQSNKSERAAARQAHESDLVMLSKVPQNRRKQHIFEEWKRRSKMRVKSTQTEPLWGRSEISAQTEFPEDGRFLGASSRLAPPTRHDLILNGSSAHILSQVPEGLIEEMDTPDSNEDDLSSCQPISVIDVDRAQDPLLLKQNETLFFGPDHDGRAFDSFGDLTTYGNYIAEQGYRRPLGSSRFDRRLSGVTSPTSVRSAPINNNNRSAAQSSSGTSGSSVQPASSTSTATTPSAVGVGDGTRWTFVETGMAPRGAPRGLVHAMWMPKRSQTVYNDDIKRLMKEIDVRLNDCKHITSESIQNLPDTQSISNLSMLGRNKSTKRSTRSRKGGGGGVTAKLLKAGVAMGSSPIDGTESH